MMNNPPPTDILTEGWPDDPGKADVEAFARDLQANLPQMSEQALQRVKA
jgi:hypothetical protein